MAKIIPITEHYQHFLAEMKESFWGDVYGETRLAWKRLLEADSERQRDRYAVREVYQRRAHRRQPYRNGYYERDFVTRLGTIRLRIARTRGKSLSRTRAFFAYFDRRTAGFLCSPDCVAEREGFEPSVQVLARTTV
jgi:hypothetical protein